jgi:uncharacterized protein with HEPN domain
MKQRLHDALEACQILANLTDERDFDSYAQDVATRGAVQWYLVSLDEALNHARALDPEIADHLPELPEVVGMRNRLVHGYWTISDKVVWTAAREKCAGATGTHCSHDGQPVGPGAISGT